MKDIQRRLIETGKRLGFRPPEVLLLLCQERFLARLSTLPESDSFVWKGGSLVLRAYRKLEPPRYTADIDLLVRGTTIEGAEGMIRHAMALDLDDGFRFSKMTKTPMQRDTPYGGDRYEIAWTFQRKGQSDALRVDICAGDDVDPARLDAAHGFLWPEESPGVSLSAYPPEFIFAEKLQTAIQYSSGNTRLKDYIDMYGLVGFGLDAARTTTAIQRCFRRRNTPMEPSSWGRLLSDRGYADLLEEARLRRYPRLQVPPAPEMFAELARFLGTLAI